MPMQDPGMEKVLEKVQEEIEYALENGVPGCTYHEPYKGECGRKVVSEDPPRCEKHQDKTCINCGDTAVKGCHSTRGLVCGFPLCEDCGIDDCPHAYPQ